MSNVQTMIENKVDNIGFEDFVMIVQDGCIKLISYADFIKNISLGGFSICAAVLNCWSSMGDFEDVIIDDDTPPTFQDLFLAIENRGTEEFETVMFLENYFDKEGDEMGYIIIKGGDFSGYKFKGQPLYQGLKILREEINQLVYNAQNIDTSYRQTVEIDVYDDKNIQAT